MRQRISHFYLGFEGTLSGIFVCGGRVGYVSGSYGIEVMFIISPKTLQSYKVSIYFTSWEDLERTDVLMRPPTRLTYPLLTF